MDASPESRVKGCDCRTTSILEMTNLVLGCAGRGADGKRGDRGVPEVRILHNSMLLFPQIVRWDKQDSDAVQLYTLCSDRKT